MNRVWLTDILKDNEKYGYGYANFAQKRYLLESISGQAIAASRELEKIALNGKFDEVDYTVTRFFDSIERTKEQLEYKEMRRIAK